MPFSYTPPSQARKATQGRKREKKKKKYEIEKLAGETGIPPASSPAEVV
jgi:hypothetical protein